MIGLLAETPVPASNTEIWTRFAIQMVTILTGFALSIYTIYRKTGGLSRKVGDAAQAAAKAAKLAEPTGNGFAKEVKEALIELKTGQTRTLGWLEKLSDAQAEDRKVMTRHLEQHVKDSSD